MKPEYRLRKGREVRRVHAQGRSCANKVAALYVLLGEGSPQVAFAVSRRLGKAVQRNSVRRRLREAYRCYQGRVRAGSKLLFVARPAAGQASFRELQFSVADLLGRSGVLMP